jgi:hypothetical protein
MSDTERPIGADAPAAIRPPAESEVHWSTRRKTWTIAGGATIVLVALWLVSLVPGWLSPAPIPAESDSPTETSGARTIQATLFYVADDGSALVPLARQVPYGATTSQQARHIVAAQIQPPPPGYVSAVPPGTTVRSVFVGGRGEAYVDLGPEIRGAHRGGSLDEALVVFAIVNAVTTNLPDVKAVQILIDGKEVDTLAGHIDLREPITRSDGWVRKDP